MGKKWGNAEGKGPAKVQSTGKRIVRQQCFSIILHYSTVMQAFRPMTPAQLESNPMFAQRTESISVPDFQPVCITQRHADQLLTASVGCLNVGQCRKSYGPAFLPD